MLERFVWTSVWSLIVILAILIGLNTVGKPTFTALAAIDLPAEVSHVIVLTKKRDGA
jgi:hypothetical protein